MRGKSLSGFTTSLKLFLPFAWEKGVGGRVGWPLRMACARPTLGELSKFDFAQSQSQAQKPHQI